MPTNSRAMKNFAVFFKNPNVVLVGFLDSIMVACEISMVRLCQLLNDTWKQWAVMCVVIKLLTAHWIFGTMACELNLKNVLVIWMVFSISSLTILVCNILHFFSVIDLTSFLV